MVRLALWIPAALFTFGAHGVAAQSAWRDVTATTVFAYRGCGQGWQVFPSALPDALRECRAAHVAVPCEIRAEPARQMFDLLGRAHRGDAELSIERRLWVRFDLRDGTRITAAVPHVAETGHAVAIAVDGVTLQLSYEDWQTIRRVAERECPAKEA